MVFSSHGAHVTKSAIAFLIMELASTSAVAQSSTGVSYSISVDDYILDNRSLDGQDVRVSGVALCGPSDCSLSGSNGPNVAVSFSTDALPRDQRKRLLGCQLLLSLPPCFVVVSGRAQAGSPPTLVATTVEWPTVPSRVELLRQQFENLGASLDLYKLDVGRYPTTEQGLAALVVRPSGHTDWNGPYTKSGAPPNDPWGHSFIYRNPSIRPGHDYDLCSVGGENSVTGDSHVEPICSP